MPFTGYGVYSLLSRLLPSEKGKAVAAGIGGWVGLNAAAFTTALMFGIQPLLHTGADGRALYAPYPLSVAVPAMLLGHATLAGAVEALMTGLVVHFLQRSQSAWVFQAAAEEARR
jgi:cobalt/nickel transport system permease protein